MSIIDCERAVWSADYFVFCRSVSEKYVLYEFNTLKLLFSETQVPTPGGLLCVPSLLEAKCPASIEEIVQRFALTGTHASGSWSRMAKEGGEGRWGCGKVGEMPYKRDGTPERFAVLGCILGVSWALNIGSR